jgi:hypothetical protein
MSSNRYKTFRQNHPDYVERERDRKRAGRNGMTEEELDEQRKRDREAKRAKREASKNVHGATYCTPQTFGKAVNKVMKALPDDESRRREVLVEINKRFGLRVVTAHSTSEWHEQLKSVDETIRLFYIQDDISRQAPGMKDVSTCKSSREKSQTRHLLYTLKEAFQLFKLDHPDVPVQFTKFAASRPYFVRLQRDIPANVCVCAIHANMHLMLDAISKVIDQPVLTASFVCDQEMETCMFFECSQCGLKVVKTVVCDWLDMFGETDVAFQQWVGGAKILQETTFTDMIDLHFLPKIGPYMRHCYVKRRQSHLFQQHISNVGEGDVVIQVKF